MVRTTYGDLIGMVYWWVYRISRLHLAPVNMERSPAHPVPDVVAPGRVKDYANASCAEQGGLWTLADVFAECPP